MHLQEALAMESKASNLKKEFYLPIDQITATALEEGMPTSRVWTMEFGSGRVRCDTRLFVKNCNQIEYLCLYKSVLFDGLLDLVWATM